MSRKVKFKIFEGPFDLLLNLINQQKLDIYDVPIAKIVEEYLVYLKNMEDLNLEIASDFLLIATTLIEIKCGALLPSDKILTETEEEGELSPEEAREMLVARLIDYKKFKNVSLELTLRAENESRAYPREAEPEEQFLNITPDFLKNVTLKDLAKAMLKFKEKNNFIEEIKTPLRFNFRERMTYVTEELKISGRKTFKNLTAGCLNKLEKIVTFLVILELYKQGHIILNQASIFGEIEVDLKNRNQMIAFEVPEEELNLAVKT
jgi:segregation and condensation protein A